MNTNRLRLNSEQADAASADNVDAETPVLDEPILAGDYTMHVGYWYVGDGTPFMCLQSMSVGRYKLFHVDTKEIRRCDIVGRNMSKNNRLSEVTTHDNPTKSYTHKPRSVAFTGKRSKKVKRTTLGVKKGDP